jgi:hypothetical protein
MGQIAAKTLIDRIEGKAEYVPEIAIEPEFVVRESTGQAPSPFSLPYSSDIDRVALD